MKACGTAAVIEGNVQGVPQYPQDKVNKLSTGIKKKKKLAKVDFAQFPFMACWYSCPRDYCHIIHFSVVHKRLVALEAQNCN